MKIRITKSEFLQLKSLLENLKLEGHKEPSFVYAKLMLDDAFHFVYSVDPLAPDVSWYLKNRKVEENDFKTYNVKTLTKQFEWIAGTCIAEVDQADKIYKEKFKEYLGNHPEAVLSVFDTKVGEKVQKIFKGIEEEEAETTLTKRQKVREKAVKMRNKSFWSDQKVERAD